MFLLNLALRRSLLGSGNTNRKDIEGILRSITIWGPIPTYMIHISIIQYRGDRNLFFFFAIADFSYALTADIHGLGQCKAFTVWAETSLSPRRRCGLVLTASRLSITGSTVSSIGMA